MHRLGPFEPQPSIAAAVSGGADSMALALLAKAWVAERGGTLLALVVDHALRPQSAAEARLTLDRLAGLGIPSRLLIVTGLPHGSALAERARLRRYEVLSGACAEAGILHLLLGHHGADQAETVAMRVLRGSLTPGLAGMSALRETRSLRLLRPLLATEPAALRRLLSDSGIDWVEDPSNRDPNTLRARLRYRLTNSDTGQTGLQSAFGAAARLRQQEEADTAVELAARATIRPEGFAVLSPGRIGVATLGRLIQTIGGGSYGPSPAQILALSAQPRPATVAGVRLLLAGRTGPGLLIVREEAAIGPPIEARTGALWDNRFRIVNCRNVPKGALIGPLGADAARFRTGSNLPSVVLRTLPAIRVNGTLVAAPQLGYANCENALRINLLFQSPVPAAGACFVPACWAAHREKISFVL